MGVSQRKYVGNNLLVMAVNYLLDRGVFSLDEFNKPVKYFRAEYLLMDIPIVITATDAGFGEVHISVVCWPTDVFRKLKCHPGYAGGKRFGEFVAECYLEREYGAWIQGGGRVHYLSKSANERLNKLPKYSPDGFSENGRVIL